MLILKSIKKKELKDILKETQVTFLEDLEVLWF